MNMAVILRDFFMGVAIGAVLLWGSAHADQTSAIHTIGVLIPPATSPEDGLRQGLRDLGYLEGKNIIIEWRRSTGTQQELRSLANELVRAKVDVIVTAGTPAARAALDATTTVPVVFFVGDPVATGLAASLARPGGNGTGVSVVSTELYPKRLELLQLLVPRARRIVFLRNSSNPLGALLLDATRKAALTLGVQLVALDARNPGELDAALLAISRSAADGILVAADLLFLANKAKIALAVRKSKLPAMFPLREYHDDGVLMSYGANYKDGMRRAATYVDKILKGAKPSDVPIEQISKYELIIDLRVAHELGLEVPQALLARADEVIR